MRDKEEIKNLSEAELKDEVAQRLKERIAQTEQELELFNEVIVQNLTGKEGYTNAKGLLKILTKLKECGEIAAANSTYQDALVLGVALLTFAHHILRRGPSVIPAIIIFASNLLSTTKVEKRDLNLFDENGERLNLRDLGISGKKYNRKSQEVCGL